MCSHFAPTELKTIMTSAFAINISSLTGLSNLFSRSAHRKHVFLFSGRNGLHVRQSTDRNAARARNLVDAQGLQHLDESFDFLFITRSLHHDLLVRDVDDLGAKNADQIQHFLALQSRFGIHGNQRHFPLDVWPGRDILHVTHTGEPRALFADLIDRAIVTPGDNRDPRPLRVKRRAHRNRFNIEPTGAEQSDDPRKLARLISDDDGKGVQHGAISDFGLRIANCGFPIAVVLVLCRGSLLFAPCSLLFAKPNPQSAFRNPKSLDSFALKNHIARAGSRRHDGKDVFFLCHHDINY